MLAGGEAKVLMMYSQPGLLTMSNTLFLLYWLGSPPLRNSYRIGLLFLPKVNNSSRFSYRIVFTT